jgi:hypothetical protein
VARNETPTFVLLEKTFPRLTSFTIATWLQTYDYTMPDGVKNDTRTIFTYTLDNYINVLRCQVSWTTKMKGESLKRIFTSQFFNINMFESQCAFRLQHAYNGSYWMHLALTWNSKSNFSLALN